MYASLGGLFLMLILAAKKYRFKKPYVWLLALSVILWLVVFYFDPGGVFVWLFD
jgi:hypothetical protein